MGDRRLFGRTFFARRSDRESYAARSDVWADSGGEQLLAGLELTPVENCYLCGCSRFAYEFERKFFSQTFRWVRCRDCGLVYQNPRLSATSLFEVYNSPQYWEGGLLAHRVGYRDYLASERKRMAQAHQRAALVSRVVGPGAQVLDVGCAAGFFLEAAHQAGLRPSGLELSSQMAQHARHRFGHPVWEGNVAHFESASVFQAVTVWGCDSNFDQPVGSFQRLAMSLVPGGYLFFNFYDYGHWFRPWLGEFKKVYNALYFLSRCHVESLLERAGCCLLEVRQEQHFATLSELAYQTGRVWLAELLDQANLGDLCVRLPVPGSFVAIARRLT